MKKSQESYQLAVGLSEVIDPLMLRGNFEKAQTEMENWLQRTQRIAMAKLNDACLAGSYSNISEWAEYLGAIANSLIDLKELILEAPPATDSRREYCISMTRHYYHERKLNQREYEEMMRFHEADPDKKSDKDGLWSALKGLFDHDCGNENCPIHGDNNKAKKESLH